jgi:hypothetical protein
VAIALCGIASEIASGAEAERNGLIVTLTDYGTDSIYVGILKGAIYSRFPGARVDSITNAVPPYDVVGGAFLLAEAAGAYPKGTVFVCVVDPGVGTSRKAIAIATIAGHYFVGPDNGLMAPAVEQEGVREVRECTNRKLWRAESTSTVFHGRDIFGPVAASLASGLAFGEVGVVLDTWVKLDVPRARIENETIHGVVVRSDPYGNLVTNIRGQMLEQVGAERGDLLRITIGDSSFAAPWLETYANAPEGEKLVVVQSAGFVECAINKGDLASAIGVGSRAEVTVRKADGR